MTQNDKDLLLKDLCSRLPYGVQMNHIADNEVSPVTLIGIDRDYVILQGAGGYSYVPVEHYKPYLLPLSSMTDEQRKELEELGLGFYVTCQDIDDDGYMWNEKVFQIIPCTETDNWMNAHHFDIHGLIEKSLAIDCTNLNIY